MSYFSGNIRQKTAAWFAVAFLLLALTIYLLADRALIAGRTLGFLGAYLSEAMLRGTPFFWSEHMANSILRANDSLFYPLAFAPYPTLGWLIGYRRPLSSVSRGRLVSTTILRFALVWIPLDAVGLWKLYRP